MSMLKMDGFDDCAIGIVGACGMDSRIVYDVEKVIEKLMSQGMDEIEAREYYEFNQAGAYVGDNGPVFLETMTMEEIEEQEDA